MNTFKSSKYSPVTPKIAKHHTKWYLDDESRGNGEAVRVLDEGPHTQTRPFQPLLSISASSPQSTLPSHSHSQDSMSCSVVLFWV